MDEMDYFEMQEKIALGEELNKRVKKHYGLQESDDDTRLSKALFKGTDCGAWIEFTETGLAVGSIVEGSDVDCTTHTLIWTGEEDVEKWLDQALKEIEEEAKGLWKEANEDDDPPTIQDYPYEIYP